MHFAVQVNFDRVQTEFLEESIKPDLVLSQMHTCGLERIDDFVRSNAAVQVTFVVGVGFDRDRLLGQFVGLVLVALEFLNFDFAKFFAVFLDHPLMVVGGDGGKPLRQQEIHRKARFDFDQITLFAEVLDIMDQQQLNPAVDSLGQTFEVAFRSEGGSFGHGEWAKKRGDCEWVG